MAEKGKEMSTIKHNDWLFEQLKDAEFAAEFLNAASEDDDPKTHSFEKSCRSSRSHLQALVGVIDNKSGCWHNRQHGSPTNHLNQEHQP
jgi:DNA-binding phage protein